jgi:hypothetical protein
LPLLLLLLLPLPLLLLLLLPLPLLPSPLWTAFAPCIEQPGVT